MKIVLILAVNRLKFGIDADDKLPAGLCKYVVKPICDGVYFIREAQLEHFVDFLFPNILFLADLSQLAVSIVCN